MISPMYQDLSQKIWGLQVREWRRVGQEWGTFEKLSVLVTFSPSQAGFKTLVPNQNVRSGRELLSGRQ